MIVRPGKESCSLPFLSSCPLKLINITSLGEGLLNGTGAKTNIVDKQLRKVITRMLCLPCCPTYTNSENT